jgi:hypothetical protein
MMRVHSKLLATLGACAVVLAACGGGTTSTPATPTPSPSISNISGDYTGTMQDAQSGSGSATATLAQNGNNAGGAMTSTLTGATLTPQISLTIDSSNNLKGAMVIDYPNGNTCTFTTSGTYANNGTSSAIINATYTAVTGCTGDTGSYVLNQQCTDTVTAERKAMAFPVKC